MKKPTKAKISDVEKLVEIMNPPNSFGEILKFMISKVFPNAQIMADRAYEIFMSKENVDVLREKTKQIYLKYYSESEIKKMLRFYQSKEGKNILSKMPAITTELALASRDWSLKIVDDSKDKIEAMINDQIDADTKAGNIRDLQDPERISEARYKFSQKYIEAKGWDSKKLSLEQISEIREQEGWKTPFK